MSSPNQPYPFVTKLIESFGDWLQHRREINELQGLDAGEFNRVAHELRVSPGDLEALIRQGPHAADELPKLLAALGIDGEAISRVQPLVYHDMERVCAMCSEKGQCDRDLAAGTSAQHYEDYCSNAQTIDSLAQKTP